MLLAGVAPLAACSFVQNTVGSGKCPSTDIAGQVGTVSRFRGQGGNVANLTYQARLTDLKGSCAFDSDGVTVTAKVTILAELGPAATERTANFPYFVAVVGPRNQVISKRVLDDELTFPPGQQRAGATDTLEERIPMKNVRDAEDYHLFLGFQLSQDELEYNRTHGGP